MNTQKLFGLGLTAALLSGFLASTASAEGTFSFYKQLGGTHTKLCTLSDEGVQRYNLKAPMNTPCSNDEASSVIIENVKAGTMLRMYDNQWGHTTDSWSEITVKQSHPKYVIHSLHQNYEDEFVKMSYHNDKNNMRLHGLNDQVSRIEINEKIPNFQ